jgi:hypothetical protein
LRIIRGADLLSDLLEICYYWATKELGGDLIKAVEEAGGKYDRET